MAAIAYGHNKSYCNTNDWTDTSKDVGAYIKSKTIAEKAAWDFFDNKAKQRNLKLYSLSIFVRLSKFISQSAYFLQKLESSASCRSCKKYPQREINQSHSTG